MHHLGDLDDVLVEQAQGVRVGEHQPGEVFGGGRAQFVHVDAAARVAAHGQRFIACHHDRGRVGTVRRVGDDDLARRPPVRLVIGADKQQPREFAVGAGRRLQGRLAKAGDLGEPALERVHQLQRPLHQRLGLVGVQAAEAFQGGDALVDLGVVLHRAGAQRIRAAVDAVVESRKLGEVAHELQLRDLGQASRRGAALLGGDELVERPLRHVASR